jgi:serine/threonine-protein kinase 11
MASDASSAVISTCKHVSVVSQVGPDSDPPVPPPKRVRKVNDYLLTSRLGRGLSSRVYLGVECSSGTRYAVKRVKLQELGRQSCAIAQLEREIRLMRTLDHRNILKLKEVLLVESTREVYLVLEYAARGSLGGYIDRHDQLPIASIFSIVKQVVAAIAYLQSEGYVHQDIKPANILLDSDGRAILADFGIGHSFQSAGMVVGSPAFQAPEALDEDQGEEDFCEEDDQNAPQKEDIWSLGVTLYLLLFQRLPFAGDTLFEIVNYIKENGLSVGHCSPDVEALVRAMLSVDSARRPGIGDLCANPLISGAPDRAVELPPAPQPRNIEGEVFQIHAAVCPPHMSFASLLVTKGDKRPVMEPQADSSDDDLMIAAALVPK